MRIVSGGEAAPARRDVPLLEGEVTAEGPLILDFSVHFPVGEGAPRQGVLRLEKGRRLLHEEALGFVAREDGRAGARLRMPSSRFRGLIPEVPAGDIVPVVVSAWAPAASAAERRRRPELELARGPLEVPVLPRYQVGVSSVSLGGPGTVAVLLRARNRLSVPVDILLEGVELQLAGSPCRSETSASFGALAPGEDATLVLEARPKGAPWLEGERPRLLAWKLEGKVVTFTPFGMTTERLGESGQAAWR